MINHVPLKLRKIHASPGAKNRILSAPFQKFSCDGREKLSVFLQLFRIYMGHFGNNMVHFPIYARLHQPVKFSDLFSILIQLYGADLKNLKGQMLHGSTLSPGALVPLQIQNNKTLHNKRV